MGPVRASGDDFPWWLIAVGLLLGGAYLAIWRDDISREVLITLRRGVWITVLVTVVSFTAASLLGLGIALMSLSRHMAIRQTARFYTEVIRGVPILVLLLYVAFVLAPGLVSLWNWAGLPEARTRDFPLLWRAVLALVIAYSAFIAEVFRAGIQSVPKGQIEAGKALGLNGRTIMRRVTLPQAVRNTLPALGNDLIALFKDTSLVSVIAAAELTYNARIYQGSSFRVRETFFILMVIYVTLTLILSLALRFIESRLAIPNR